MKPQLPLTLSFMLLLLLAQNGLAQSCQSNFLLKWGTQGTAAGQFNTPVGVAVDSAGNVFVADIGNNRVQKFDNNGNFLLTFGWGVRTGANQFEICTTGCLAGIPGAGAGQTNGPLFLAVDSSNNVYVGETLNGRVEKFDSNGNFLFTFGAGQFNQPYGIAVDTAGNIYVSDTFNSRIVKFDSTGAFLFNFPAGINPSGLVVDAAGNVYAADQTASVVNKYSPLGVFISSFGSFGGGNGQFSQPYGIARDSLGNIYVSELGNMRVQKFDSLGNFLATWGSLGAANSQFNRPHSLGVDAAGNVFVSDATNQRVQKFGCGASAGAPRLSDQKSGSLLVFPFYGSTSAANDTRLTLTNVGPSPLGAPNQASTIGTLNVHLFWLDSSCSQADIFICLTKYQSFTFKASEWDPVTTRGTMIAVVVDPSGFPIAYNGLIGNAFVNFTSADGNRYLGNYSAEAFAAIGAQTMLPNNGGTFFYTTSATPLAPANTATLNFNGAPASNAAVGYDAAPNRFAAEFLSPVNASGQTLLMASLNGILGGTALTGAGQLGVGTIYRNDEKLYSFTGINSGCNAITVLDDKTPRIIGGLSKSIGSGQTGTMLWTSPGGAVGLFITPTTSGAKTNPWSGIRGLHKLATTTAALTMPVFMPGC